MGTARPAGAARHRPHLGQGNRPSGPIPARPALLEPVRLRRQRHPQGATQRPPSHTAVPRSNLTCSHPAA